MKTQLRKTVRSGRLKTAGISLRDMALERAFAFRDEVARRAHQSDFRKLMVGPDGELYWDIFTNLRRHVSVNQYGYPGKPRAAGRSLITVGTGRFSCDCLLCAELRDSQERDRDILAAFKTIQYKRRICKALDAIPVGFFDDEEIPR